MNPRLDPRKAPRQDRSRRTVERILAAAAHIFDEDGYAATTTNEIAAMAEVSIGSLYQYFPNKDAILVALGRRHVETVAAGLTHLLGGVGPDADLRAVIDVVVRFLVDQHAHDGLHRLVAHEAPRTPELVAELDRARVLLVGFAAELLAGRLPAGADTELVASMMVAVVDAGVHDVIIRRPAG
ncbi:MAG: TetR/AcrR family transcriptional regulator, partial [Actinobacteria bacterium]|nr:TetR/AcrR family transcriptional regulator [Actinomycetota bacterium]